MNGLDLLIGVAIVGVVAYVLSKITLLKQERQFWKDSCFIMAEKYNDLLVKDSMDRAIDKTFKEDRLKVN